MSSAIASLRSQAGGLGKRLIYDSLKVIYAHSRAQWQSRPPQHTHPFPVESFKMNSQPLKKKKKRGLPPTALQPPELRL